MDRTEGHGEMRLTGVPLPAVKGADMLRNALVDYQEAGGNDILQAWIRRAIHAETFARSLEAALEKLRETEK